MARPVELAIVIVNWNAGELLARCIASIRRHPPRVGYEIIVVDNASNDGSVEPLRAAAAGDHLRLIENRENLGFARGNNLGIAQSRAPHLLLLNPDTEVGSGAIDALLATIDSQPRIGACAPRLLNHDGSVQPSVWPAPPTPLQILFEGLRLYRLLPRRLRARWLLGAHWDHATRRRVDFFFGAAMMVKRAMIDEVGAFDESFALYGEDYEWCVRMGRRGWQLYFEPAAEVLHHGGRSARQRWSEEEISLLKAQASIHCHRRLLPAAQFALSELLYAFVLAMIGAWRSLRRKPAHTILALSRIHWGAFRRAIAAQLPGARARLYPS